jgi:hypothetical protein
MLHDAWKALQGETYFIANMETDYHQARFLYHTTLFQSLKCILKDGYITGSADEKRRHHATGSMHDGVVCFTTNPLRHLTNLPSFGIMLGWISHDVYFRFPWRVLSEQGAKPVAYKLTLPEMKDMPTHLHSQFLSEEKAKQMYGDDLDSFVYTTWVEENEWRIKTRHFALPPETEIFVSSPQQLRVVRALTSFPVTIDSAIQDFRLALREPKIIRDVRRLQRRLECAADNTLRAKAHCEDLARFRNMSKDDTVIISLIHRAERIISKRDKTEAKQWLTDFKAVEYIVTKWEPTPFWREDGFARSQYGKAKQTYVS